MKDVKILFDTLIDKATSEADQPSAMKHEMALREFFLLNLSVNELHSLALSMKHVSERLADSFLTDEKSDLDLLMESIPAMWSEETLSELPEETLMLLTNMTVDHLLESEEGEYNELTIEEFIHIYETLRPTFDNIRGNDGDDYTPISIEKYSLYVKAIETLNENREAISQGNLESLKPLYSPELMNVERAIDELYDFTIKVRYDLALIWAIRKKMMKISPVSQGGITIDWEMEIAPHFSDSVISMLNDTFKSKDSE